MFLLYRLYCTQEELDNLPYFFSFSPLIVIRYKLCLPHNDSPKRFKSGMPIVTGVIKRTSTSDPGDIQCRILTI